MITADDVRTHIALGREQAGVEFKSAGDRSDKSFFAKIARAMIAMANRRDGGVVILGVTEKDDQLVIVGLNDAAAGSWKFDHLADALAPYVEPKILFDVRQLEIGGQIIVAIKVSEFDEVPVVCRRDYPGSLQEGVCYVRPRRKPESVPVGTYEDMRELLDLATDKATRRFLSRASRAGLVPADAAAIATSDRQFADEAGGF